MENSCGFLPLPDEPVELRANTRSLLEESPEEGADLIADAAFIAEPLWEEWGDTLESAGVDYARFVEISRGYAAEIRLWVVGERIWDHFVSGLAGRVRRRSSVSGSGKALVASEVCG